MQKEVYIVLSISLIIMLAGCSSQDTFTGEYNAKLNNINALIQEHDALIKEVNSDVNNLEMNQIKMKEYLSWTDKNRQAFYDFKSYIEANHQKIQDAGQNPDNVRDNVNKVIDLMQQNDIKFTAATQASPCPDLSSMKLQNYDALMQTWTAQVFPYKSGNVEVVYTFNSQIEGKKNVVYCDVGSSEGQNANWVYCGDTLRPIVAQYTDSSGTIVKKRAVEVTFDKNTMQYLATKCDTYTLV